MTPLTPLNAGGTKIWVVAEPVSWLGLTRKWGRRWIAQILIPGEVLWTCSHFHVLKKDAIACGNEKLVDLAEREGAPVRGL